MSGCGGGGVECEWMVGRVVGWWSRLVWVDVMIGAWVPVCVCLGSGKSSFMRAWRGKEVMCLLV